MVCTSGVGAHGPGGALPFCLPAAIVQGSSMLQPTKSRCLRLLAGSWPTRRRCAARYQRAQGGLGAGQTWWDAKRCQTPPQRVSSPCWWAQHQQDPRHRQLRASHRRLLARAAHAAWHEGRARGGRPHPPAREWLGLPQPVLLHRGAARRTSAGERKLMPAERSLGLQKQHHAA